MDCHSKFLKHFAFVPYLFFLYFFSLFFLFIISYFFILMLYAFITFCSCEPFTLFLYKRRLFYSCFRRHIPLFYLLKWFCGSSFMYIWLWGRKRKMAIRLEKYIFKWSFWFSLRGFNNDVWILFTFFLLEKVSKIYLPPLIHVQNKVCVFCFVNNLLSCSSVGLSNTNFLHLFLIQPTKNSLKYILIRVDCKKSLVFSAYNFTIKQKTFLFISKVMRLTYTIVFFNTDNLCRYHLNILN